MPDNTNIILEDKNISTKVRADVYFEVRQILYNIHTRAMAGKNMLNSATTGAILHHFDKLLMELRLKEAKETHGEEQVNDDKAAKFTEYVEGTIGRSV
jgi:hypothetical protein